MSSQSWLDYRIKRINYFLRVVLVSIIYYKHKQSITSTHTNYFDQVFKERQGQPLVELDNYTDPIQLVNVLLTLFSIPAHRRALLNPYEASHYNLPTPFVNIIVEFIFLPAILPTLSEKPAPKELRIVQPSQNTSRGYFLITAPYVFNQSKYLATPCLTVKKSFVYPASLNPEISAWV